MVMLFRFGRKPVLYASLLTYVGFMVVAFFVTHLYEVYLVVATIASTGLPMMYSLPAILVAECSGNGTRSVSICYKRNDISIACLPSRIFPAKLTEVMEELNSKTGIEYLA